MPTKKDLRRQVHFEQIFDSIADGISVHNTTDNLLFQKALLEAENEASQDGRLIVSPKGAIVSFNSRFLEMWGIAADELERKTEKERLNLLKHKVMNPSAFVKYVHSINADQSKIATDELEMVDGRILERYTTPLKGPHKEVYGRIWFIRDITEQKREFKRQEIFLGIASHELRTPLSSIKAYLHLINADILKNKVENIADYVQKIDNQTSKLNKLIKDLLDISTIRADRLELNKEIFDFDQFINEVVNELKPTSEHGIIIKGATKKYIEADKLRLNEVFTNLLRNAIKYSPLAKKINVYLSAPRKSVQVAIEDFGVGIPEKHVGKIFDLFFRVSNSSGISGFGVGLFISHEIVKRHKGNITVISIPKKGTTFTVTLPIKS